MTCQCGLYSEFFIFHRAWHLWIEIMASSSKRARVKYIEESQVLALVLQEETTEGMDSGEESDLDRQLENRIEDSRWVFIISLRERVAIEHMVLKMQTHTAVRPSFMFQISPISRNFLKSIREFIFGTKRGIKKVNNFEKKHPFERCDSNIPDRNPRWRVTRSAVLLLWRKAFYDCVAMRWWFRISFCLVYVADFE